MSIFVLAFSLAPLILTAYFVVCLMPTGGKIASWLQGYVITLSLVVLIALIGNLFGLVSALPMFAISLIICGGVGFWAYKARVLQMPNVRPGTSTLFKFVKEHWIVSLIVSIICVGHILNMIGTLRLFPLFGDAEAYHLPRAYFWEQLKSFDSFPSGDARQNESPLNSNILLLWLFVFGRNYALAFLPQLIAGIVLSFATFKLARFAKVTVTQAILISCILACVPQFVLQVTNASNDLVVASFAMLAFLFGLRAMSCSKEQFIGSALTCALAAGFALGAKVTAFIVVGGVALALLAFALSHRVEINRLVRLAVMGMASFLVIGSYQYVINFADFGNPFFSPIAEAEHSEIFSNESRSVKNNVALTVLQTLDLNGYAHGTDDPIREAQKNVNIGLLDSLDVNDRSKRNFIRYFDISSQRADWNGSGYSVWGFLAIVISPFLVLLGLFWRRTIKWQVIGFSAFIFLVYLIGMSVIVPWNATAAIRYLMNGFPFVALAGGLALSSSRFGTLLLGTVAVLMLPILGYVVHQGGEGARVHSDSALAKPFKGPIHYLYGGVQAPNIQAFDQYFDDESRVGVFTKKHAYQFYFFRDMPSISFVPYGIEDGFKAVNNGDLQGMVVSRASPIPDVMREKLIPTIFDRRAQFGLYVRDPKAFFELNKSFYGIAERDGSFVIKGRDLRTFMVLDNRLDGGRGLTPRSYVWNTNHMELRLPAFLLNKAEAGFTVSMELDKGLESVSEMTIECAGSILTPQLAGQNRVTLKIDTPACLKNIDKNILVLLFKRNDRENIRINELKLTPNTNTAN